MLGPVWAGRIVSESEPTRRLSPVTYAFAASLIGLLLATAPILATRTNYLQFNRPTERLKSGTRICGWVGKNSSEGDDFGNHAVSISAIARRIVIRLGRRDIDEMPSRRFTVLRADIVGPGCDVIKMMASLLRKQLRHLCSVSRREVRLCNVSHNSMIPMHSRGL